MKCGASHITGARSIGKADVALDVDQPLQSLRRRVPQQAALEQAAAEPAEVLARERSRAAARELGQAQLEVAQRDLAARSPRAASRARPRPRPSAACTASGSQCKSHSQRSSARALKSLVPSPFDDTPPPRRLGGCAGPSIGSAAGPGGPGSSPARPRAVTTVACFAWASCSIPIGRRSRRPTGTEPKVTPRAAPAPTTRRDGSGHGASLVEASGMRCGEDCPSEAPRASLSVLKPTLKRSESATGATHGFPPRCRATIASTHDRPHRFDHFELHPAERCCASRGEPAVARRARLRSPARAGPSAATGSSPSSELLDLVWPGLVVEEHNIAAQIGTLRKLLGAGVIATVAARGYRFDGRADAPHRPQPAAAALGQRRATTCRSRAPASSAARRRSPTCARLLPSTRAC